METLEYGANATSYARPEHILPQPHTLLPRGLLRILVVSPPVAILDDPQETEEVAGGSHTTETIPAERVALRGAALAGAEAVSSEILVILAILSAEGAWVELRLGEHGVCARGWNRLNDQGAIRHG